MSKVICVANLRKQSGRTCTAVNFAVSLSLLDKKVLVVDCDANARASACLGFSPGDYDYGLDDALCGIVGGRAVVTQTSIDDLDLIPAGQALDTMDETLKHNPDKDKVLSIILNKFREQYDYIVFDTPGNTGMLTRSALVASDSLMIPVHLSPDTPDDLNRILKFASITRKSMEIPLKISGIVVMACKDMDDIKDDLSGTGLSDFKHALFPVAIPEQSWPDGSEPMMKPVCLVDIKSPVSEAYLDLSFEFLYRENIRET